MDRPEELVLDGGSYFALAGNSAVIGLAFLAFVCGIVLVFYGAILADLVLPIASLSAIWFAWVAINLIVGLIHIFGDRRAINRLFEGEIWGHWQLRAPEWQGVVEAEYQIMCPEEGLGAYVGAVYSSILGLAFAAILVAVGEFAIKGPPAMPAIWSFAVVVFLGFRSFVQFHAFTVRLLLRALRL